MDRSSFSDESLSDVDDRNNEDVGELSNQTGGETDTDSGSIFDGYSDVSDDKSDGSNAEDKLRTVLSMLDDAYSLIFGLPFSSCSGVCRQIWESYFFNVSTMWRHCCINFLARILRWRPCQVAYAVFPSIFEQTKACMTTGYSQEPIEECSVGRPLSVLKPASLTLDLSSSKVGSYTDSNLGMYKDSGGRKKASRTQTVLNILFFMIYILPYCFSFVMQL